MYVYMFMASFLALGFSLFRVRRLCWPLRYSSHSLILGHHHHFY